MFKRENNFQPIKQTSKMKNLKLAILLILIATGLSSCYFGGSYGRDYSYNNRYARNYRPYNYGYNYNLRPRYYYSNPRHNLYNRNHDYNNWAYKNKGSKNNDRAYSDNRGKGRGKSRGSR